MNYLYNRREREQRIRRIKPELKLPDNLTARLRATLAATPQLAPARPPWVDWRLGVAYTLAAVVLAVLAAYCWHTSRHITMAKTGLPAARIHLSAPAHHADPPIAHALLYADRLPQVKATMGQAFPEHAQMVHAATETPHRKQRYRPPPCRRPIRSSPWCSYANR